MIINKFLKKAGLYVAISFLFIGIGALLALLIIRRGIDSGGIAGIDGNISDIRNGIAEATELNTAGRTETERAGEAIDNSIELNNGIRNDLEQAGNSVDSLTAASERLAKLIRRLNEKAKDT